MGPWAMECPCSLTNLPTATTHCCTSIVIPGVSPNTNTRRSNGLPSAPPAGQEPGEGERGPLLSPHLSLARAERHATHSTVQYQVKHPLYRSWVTTWVTHL